MPKDEMVSMKLPKPKKQTMSGEMADSPRYPWGLQVRLGKEELAKLGITDLPEVGSTIILSAKCSVDSTSSRETREGGVDKDMSLQITEMSLGDDKKDKGLYS